MLRDEEILCNLGGKHLCAKNVNTEHPKSLTSTSEVRSQYTWQDVKIMKDKQTKIWVLTCSFTEQ